MVLDFSSFPGDWNHGILRRQITAITHAMKKFKYPDNQFLESWEKATAWAHALDKTEWIPCRPHPLLWTALIVATLPYVAVLSICLGVLWIHLGEQYYQRMERLKFKWWEAGSPRMPSDLY